METIGSSESGNENEGGTDAQAPVQAQVAKSEGKPGTVLNYFSRKARENLETALGPRVKQADQQIQVKA